MVRNTHAKGDGAVRILANLAKDAREEVQVTLAWLAAKA